MKFAYYLVALVLSGLVVLASVFVPVTVSSRSELTQMKFGSPLPFVVQDQSHYDPPFPWRFGFNFNPWEPSLTWLLWPEFLLDVALVFGALVIILRVILPMSILLPARLLRLLPQFLQPCRSEPMKSAYYLVALILSGLLVLASIFVPVTVSSRSELAQMKFGSPLPFVVQDQSRYDPPFPWQFGFDLNPWEAGPAWILLPQFLLDVVLVFGVLIVILHVIRKVWLKIPLLMRKVDG